MEGGQWHGEFVDPLGLLGSSALLACWLSAWVHGCAGRHEHESANGDAFSLMTKPPKKSCTPQGIPDDFGFR